MLQPAARGAAECCAAELQRAYDPAKPVSSNPPAHPTLMAAETGRTDRTIALQFSCIVAAVKLIILLGLI